MAKIPVVSVFSSIQGEGLYAGKPHLFIRFAGCNIRCSYCDTPEGLAIPKYCQIETKPFTNTLRKCRNPIDNDYLLNAIKRLAALFPHYHAIALTGGEPLLHTAFLKTFLTPLKRLKIPVMLETNGTLPKQLKEIINLIDIISMDIKIPSDVNKKQNIWEPAKQFLSLSARKSYVKIIVTQSTKTADYQQAARIISSINKNIPVILQPVSATRKGVKTPPLNQLIVIHNIFTKELTDVRIIPQVHRMMNWR